MNQSARPASASQSKTELLRSTSKDAFDTEYKRIYGKNPTREESFHLILSELESAFSEGDEEKIRKGTNLINLISSGVNFDSSANLSGPLDGNVRDLNPIHVAAREGLFSCVQYFLNDEGNSADESDNDKVTLLHYAVMKNKTDILKYLIAKGANVMAKDCEGQTPLHTAAIFSHKDSIEILLKNGAIYNDIDNSNRKPLDLATTKYIKQIFSATANLFEAVKKNNLDEVVKAIKDGAFVDARDAKGTVLHYAAWKGYVNVVNVLLDNKANPNALGNGGFTPLHYAAKFSHLKIAKALLGHGAIYDAISDNGKTPADISTNMGITSLLTSIDGFFAETRKHCANTPYLDVFKRSDVDTIKALVNTRNRAGESYQQLVENFDDFVQQSLISEGDAGNLSSLAHFYHQHGMRDRAIMASRSALEVGLNAAGDSDSRETLVLRAQQADTLRTQGKYLEALDLYEEVLQRRIKLLGENDAQTLETHCDIAMQMHHLGRNEEALNIFRRVLPKLVATLGPNNYSYILATKNHMGLVLHRLGNYNEALSMHREAFEQGKKVLGADDPITLAAQHNVALVLDKLGKHDEALSMLCQALDGKIRVAGATAPGTLRTLHTIGYVLASKGDKSAAMKIFEEVLKAQKNVLPPSHPDISTTEISIAALRIGEGKYGNALKTIHHQSEMRGNFGENQEIISNAIERVNRAFGGATNFLNTLQSGLIDAARTGNMEALRRILYAGVDVNEKDANGRTALHQAVSNGHLDIVKILLENGADVLQVTSKGNTPLHIAALKGYEDISELMLQKVGGDKLISFINAKTTSGGSTSLHVAAKRGALMIVECLLKFGAIYNIQNSEGKIPMELSTDGKVTDLLKLVHELFDLVMKGDSRCIGELRALELDAVKAVINARNNEGNTFLQVAMVNKHKNIADQLLGIVKLTL